MATTNKTSLSALTQKRQEIDAEIEIAIEEDKAVAREQITAVLTKHGYTLADLYPSLGRRRSVAGAGVPKYRNPANANETWTGRGRPPAWIVAGTKNGKTDHMLIKK